MDTEKKEETQKVEVAVNKDDATKNLANDVANLKVADGEQRPGSTSPSTPAAGADGKGGVGTGSFIATFKAFSKFGDIKSDGKHITLSQSDKWMKQAKVIDKKITTTDTGIYFKKQKYACDGFGMIMGVGC